MIKTILTTALLVSLLTFTPAFADADHDHDTPVTGHGSASDDHNQIVALDVTPGVAVTTLEDGLAALSEKTTAGTLEGVAADAHTLMSAVKTLTAASPDQRQSAALKQLDQQLDAAKHAAEDSNLEKSTSSITKAQSALKLYKALR